MGTHICSAFLLLKISAVYHKLALGEEKGLGLVVVCFTLPAVIWNQGSSGNGRRPAGPLELLLHRASCTDTHPLSLSQMKSLSLVSPCNPSAASKSPDFSGECPRSAWCP